MTTYMVTVITPGSGINESRLFPSQLEAIKFLQGTPNQTSQQTPSSPQPIQLITNHNDALPTDLINRLSTLSNVSTTKSPANPNIIQVNCQRNGFHHSTQIEVYPDHVKLITTPNNVATLPRDTDAIIAQVDTEFSTRNLAVYAKSYFIKFNLANPQEIVIIHSSKFWRLTHLGNNRLKLDNLRGLILTFDEPNLCDNLSDVATELTKHA